MKAAESLPGIIGALLSWILINAADVVKLGIPKSMGIGFRYWRIALYIHGYQEENNYTTLCRNIIQCSKYHQTHPIPVMVNVINAKCLSCCLLIGL